MSLSEKLKAARVALGKRKERAEGLAAPAPAAKAEPAGKPAPARRDNKLLAGYLANEFLTSGTILGRRVEPSRGGPAAASVPAPAGDTGADPDAKRRYTEVSMLLMSGGAHIPGVVNPTQLARWLHIKE